MQPTNHFDNPQGYIAGTEDDTAMRLTNNLQEIRAEKGKKYQKTAANPYQFLE